jgi:hypothetical protein
MYSVCVSILMFEILMKVKIRFAASEHCKVQLEINEGNHDRVPLF